MAKKSVNIYVDADACPVKHEIIHLANTYNASATFVASYSHVPNETNGAKWVFVDTYKEAADLYILNLARQGDIVVSQDTGLASMLVNRGVYVLSPRGKLYNDQEMETILHLRYLSAKERRSGKYSKGPKPFSEHDREHFITSLNRILSKLEGE